MLKRVSLSFILLPGALLSFSLNLFLIGNANAAVIDPDLQAAFHGKAANEQVRVLMLMDEYTDLASVSADFSKAVLPETRRRAVVAALKAHASTTQASARAILSAAEQAGQVRDMRVLWLANAIAFRGDRAVVEALAAANIQATLLHDKPYDMISSVMGSRPAPKTEGNLSGLFTTTPAIPDTVWSVKWINANRVWLDTGFTGAGVVVSLYDTGAWLTHPDLVNRFWVNPSEIPGNGLDDDSNGYVDDVHGYDFADLDSDPNDDVAGAAYNHGTHTGGTVCGDGTNGTLTGVAPGASLMLCKVFLSDGTGAPFSAIYEGQQYALMMGAQVFTMSLGIGGELAASVMRAERNNGNALREAGVVYFNSAGNDHFAFEPPIEIGLTARVPAPWIAGTPEVNPVPYSSRGGVITVGGTGYMDDNVYSASSRGPVDWEEVSPWNDWPYSPGPGLTKPDIAAPGINVNSLQKPNGYTGDTWSGTSMSCPHAAGVAALMLEKNPTLSPAGVDSIMEQNAVDLGTPGKDNTFGSGRLDALAAVNAVPSAQMPHLVTNNIIIIDAGGDGVIDPGESFDLVFELANNSRLIDASSVAGGLTVIPNAHVSVTDGSGNFPDIATGGTGDNSADVFSLTAAAGAPQGFSFTAMLTVMAQNGYQKTFDIDLFIGLPDWLDHDIGGVRLTVTDQGIIGYMTSAQVQGNGFGPIDGVTGLFVGSFWAGTGLAYVCNNDYGNGDIAEWQVVTNPNGRIKNLGAHQSDQTYQAIFTDSNHPSPQPVTVTRRSYAWASEPSDRFVIMQYTIRNDGASSLDDYHVGIFCDFDIGDYETNEGASDQTYKLSYLRNSGGTSFYGIALLGESPVANLTMIHNQTYVYTNGYIDDGIKGRHLKGIISTAETSAPADWSCLTSSGPYSLASGESITVAFALVYAQSLPELLGSVDIANDAVITPIFLSNFLVLPRQDSVLIEWEAMFQNPSVEFRLTGRQGAREWDIPYQSSGANRFEATDTEVQRYDGSTVTYSLYYRELGQDWLIIGSKTLEMETPQLDTRIVGVHPNPFNPQTTIAYSMAVAGQAKLAIYDLLGRKIAELFQGQSIAGRHEITWDGRDQSGSEVASGVYVVRLETMEAVFTQKILLNR